MIERFNARDLFALLAPRRGAGGGAVAAAPADRQPATTRSARERLDTVTLSGDGQKIVNLNRARELGAELRAEKDPEAFKEKLRLAMEDVRRIGRLFGEVVRTASRGSRPPLG